MGFTLAIYAAGVVVGLLFTDARPWARLAIALSWPLGALAFVVTIATLVVTAALVFPVFGVMALAAAVAAWVWLL